MLAPSIYNPNINYLWRLILYVRGRLSVKLQIVVSGVYYLWWGVFHPGSLCNIPVHLTMYIVHWGKISFSFPRLNILLHTHLHCESGIQEKDVLRRTSVLCDSHTYNLILFVAVEHAGGGYTHQPHVWQVPQDPVRVYAPVHGQCQGSGYRTGHPYRPFQVSGSPVGVIAISNIWSVAIGEC